MMTERACEKIEKQTCVVRYSCVNASIYVYAILYQITRTYAKFLLLEILLCLSIS